MSFYLETVEIHHLQRCRDGIRPGGSWGIHSHLDNPGLPNHKTVGIVLPFFAISGKSGMVYYHYK